MKRQTMCIITGLAGVFLEYGTTKAALFSSVSYYQELTGQENADSNTYSRYFSGTTLPVNQSQTLTLPDGNTISANYNFTQDNNSASFYIGSTASILYSNSTLLQTHGDSPGQSFYFTPAYNVAYVMQFSGNASTGAQSSVDLQLDAGAGGGSFDDHSLSSVYESGHLMGGLNYNLFEAWDLDLPISLGGGPNSATGSSLLSITFTAIPEPSSLMMICGCATLLLKRPMRWVRADVR